MLSLASFLIFQVGTRHFTRYNQEMSFEKPSLPACVVCPYAPQPCEIPSLRGRLSGVVESASAEAPGGSLLVSLPDGPGVTLLLEDARWLSLLPQLARVLRQGEGSAHPSQPVELAAYHLHKIDLHKIDDGRLTAGLVILEPDWLINVTDLTRLEYCPRQYLVDRFQINETNIHLLRGNIVHRTFEQILKTPQDEAAITGALKQAFFEQAREMAFLDQTKAGVWEQVKDHYHRLKAWARTNHRPGTPHSESFLLAPQLGMKGKIDALWFQDGKTPLIVELKTSRSQGRDPKPGHAFQAGAYSLMTGARGWSSPRNQATLVLYSGNHPLGAFLNIERQISMSLEGLRDAVYHRNQLVLADTLSDAPFETVQPNKCINCSVGEQCAAIGYLFDHLDPRLPTARWIFNPGATLGDPEKEWFQTFARLLFMEYRAVKTDHAALWQLSPGERILRGRTFVASSWRLIFSEMKHVVYFLEGVNQSELREEDFVLVSDQDGPMRGLLAQGTVKRPLENGLEVEFGEQLEFEPRVVDSYVSENLVGRLFAGIRAWLDQDPSYRDLVVRGRLPEFRSPPVAPHYPPLVGPRQLNRRQQEAVSKALNMQDCLLVLGPPGSGKTMLIVALVREFLQLNRRVLLAAGTNTALDNLLKPLIDAGYGDQVLRLGVEGRTDPALKEFVPEVLARHADLDTHVQQLRRVLLERQVVGATATTWLSNTWGVFDKFDVAIVDEAAQMTLPATLGALRLARQFILIGDHKQLPPVVISEQRQPDQEAGNSLPRLSLSLFELLYRHYQRHSPQAIVNLNEQYRMNEEICAITRRMWYDEDLKPALDEIARARLSLARPLDRNHPLYPALDPQEPVIFLNVPWSPAWTGPRTNLHEAQAVGQILKAYLEAGLSLGSLGVIAPFRAQVALIRRTLETLFPGLASSIRLVVDTVDRFQGQERDLILISLATHGDTVHELLQDERRLNVAITRARHKLVILGDKTVLQQHPLYGSLLEQCSVVNDGSMVFD